MSNNELYVRFNPDFLEKIETLGNSVTVSHYNIEDIRGNVSNIDSLLNENDEYKYNNESIPLYGFWDEDRKELKVHVSLFKYAYSNKVKKVYDGDIEQDPVEFEFESVNSFGEHNGDGLVRVLRFMYNTGGNNGEEIEETAFIVTGDIKTSSVGTGFIIDPISCNQDKILITVGFPSNTKANIKTLKEEKDTWFLEGSGILKGDNVFKTYSDDTLASRHSSLSFLKSKATEIRFDKKDVSYIGNDGKDIYRRDRFRLYTNISIYCANLLTNVRPKTRASLNTNGGILRIYGSLSYLEYEVRGNEFIFIGNGSESIDGLPDSELILTTHEKGLIDVSVDKFYVSYGKYEGQDDPSVLVKARVRFYNLFTKEVETIESENIRLTQEENIVPQWEIINRSTQYTESTPSGKIYVYMFPLESGFRHSFTIRTTFPNINIERDFVTEYSDPILETYFDLTIQKVPYRDYPITDYVVTIESKTDNLDTTKWLPIINEKSELKLTTLRLLDYDYTEPFYFVQSPKSPSIELHDSDNNNLSEISLEYNQEVGEFYPVAPETSEEGDIGIRNSWIVLDHDDRVEIENPYGLLNPNNYLGLEHKLLISIAEEPTSISSLDLGKIVIGRIKESESSYNFSDSEWRSSIGLSKITLPIQKRGIIETIQSDENIILEEINLYSIKVICNGSFACWMNESEDYCFFNPRINKPTYTNYYYSDTFNNVDGVYVYIALHNTTITDEEIFEDNRILFTVSEEEPDWSNGKPECFNNPENISECIVYRKGVEELSLNYFNPEDIYVFLGSYEETELRFVSKETPVIDRLQILDNSDLDRLSDGGGYYSRPTANYNQISILDAPTPTYTVLDKYRYHSQHLQNTNELFGYYPISPSCIYRVHSYNDSDLCCPFFLFRKALGPNFYRSDSSTGNVIYAPANPNENSGINKRKNLVIRSRYEIPDEEFVRDLNISNSFSIESINHTILNTNDYKHQYVVVIRIDRVNYDGGQRQLGSITITSKIYNLINYVSSESVTIPYIELTQDYIDTIVPPATMRVLIIQESGNPNPDIEIVGNRDSIIPSIGETRSFTINSGKPINTPTITYSPNSALDNCVTGISTEGFNLVVPSIVNDYNLQVVPSETSSYTKYTQRRNIGFNITIEPVESGSSSYSESFNFEQNGISKGLIFATPNDTPKLYLGISDPVNITVSAQTTTINVFLGIFGIGSQITEGTKGTAKGLTIDTQHTYTILNESCYYYNESWNPSISLQFPANTSGSAKNRNFTVTYVESGITHKIPIVVNQLSSSGNIICNDNAYFLSHGECIESSDYSNSLGLFSFDTDIPISSLSLNIPNLLYDTNEPYYFQYIGPSSKGSGYKAYKAFIKLKPNLSNSTIGKQIFSFKKNGTTVKNVTINQGFYNLMVCNPGSTDTGVYSGGTLGSVENPFEVPSKNNNYTGTRKLFNLIIKRSEPIPETGKYTHENISFNNIYFPTVTSYTWTCVNSHDHPNTTNTEPNIRGGAKGKDTNNHEATHTNSNTPIGVFLSDYNTELFPSSDLSEYPFLENLYTVKPASYSTSICIKINLSIIVKYPYTDPLWTIYGKNTTHSYTIYLLKRSDTTYLT